MSFVVGLAIFGGTLAVSVTSYVRASTREAEVISTRILLESAATQTLGQLVANAPPPSAANGLSIRVSATSAKYDLGMDGERDLKTALNEAGIPIRSAVLRNASGLTGLVAGAGLSAREEDKLRQGFTFGRAPAQRNAHSEMPLDGISPGDQFDIRVTLNTPQGETVLWLRTRFSGNASGWYVQDYRRLYLAPATE